MSQFDTSRFSPKPDEELICGICMNVLDNPLESPCRHVFCDVCIKRCLQHKSECPLCRKNLKTRHLKSVLPLVQNIINKLKLKCDNYENGCTDLIQKEHFLDHVKSCGYMIVQCQYNECHQQLLLKDRDEHEKNVCVYRDFTCTEGCGLMVKSSDKNTHSCMESLLSHVKVLNGKISCLEGKVDELNSVIVGLTSKLEDYGCSQNQTDRDRDDDNVSTHFRSPSTWSRPFSLDSNDSYSRSVNLSPRESWANDLSDTSDSSMSHSNGVNNRYTDVENDEESEEDIVYEPAYSEDIETEYVPSSPAYEEAVDISSSPVFHGLETSDPPNDDLSENNNMAQADLSVTVEDTQSDPIVVLGFSGSVVAAEENDTEDTIMRRHENNTDEGESQNENKKQSTISLSVLGSESFGHAGNDAARIGSTSAGMDASESLTQCKAKRHTSTSTKHNKRAKMTSENPTSSGSFNTQGSTLNINPTENVREQSNQNESVANIASSRQNSLSSTNTDSSRQNPTRPTRTRSGPLTRRSARIQNMKLAPDSRIQDVRIPKSAADLLLELEEYDSSSDESWTPGTFD